MFWQSLAYCAVIALALNTEHEIMKAIQFLRGADMGKLPSCPGKVVYNNTTTDVPLRKYPFVALTVIKSPWAKETCTGTIVHKSFVLTSGKCVPGDPTVAHEGIVFAGDVNYKRNKTFEKANIQIRTVSQFNYSGEPEVVVLLKLHRPFVLYTKYVSEAFLTRDKAFNASLNIKCTAIGFANPGYTMGLMTEHNFQTIPGPQCSSSLSETLLCSHDDPLNSVCDGDRGGPLIKEKKEVYGFIRERELEDPSSGDCGSAVKYNTFWFAGAYTDWIKQVVQQSKAEEQAEEHMSHEVRGTATRGRCPLPYLLTCALNLVLSL